MLGRHYRGSLAILCVQEPQRHLPRPRQPPERLSEPEPTLNTPRLGLSHYHRDCLEDVGIVYPAIVTRSELDRTTHILLEIA
jgi:hypothetical protein